MFHMVGLYLSNLEKDYCAIMLAVAKERVVNA